jgi:hypothetical protein
MKFLPDLVRLVIFLIALLAAKGALASTVTINEAMASNFSTIAAEDGSYHDWIELFNWGPAPIALGGYGLTDDPADPFRWVFPSITLQSGQYLLIWASGNDMRDPARPLHANFRLSSDGEPLLLSGPAGEIVSEMPSRPIPRGVSLGRSPNGTGAWKYFTEPTPRQPNSTPSFTFLAGEPIFSHDAGFYDLPFLLSLAAVDGGTIYYTLDGSNPDPGALGGSTYQIKNDYPHGPLLSRSFRTWAYSGPIEVRSRRGEANKISEIASAFNGFNRPGTEWEPPSGEVFKATVVRARVLKADAVPGPVVTRTFFVDEQIHQRYSLPVISLTTPERGLFDYTQGVYVPGKTFNDWRLNNPNAVVNGSTPANYLRSGRSSELPAHIEFFEPDGANAFSQNVGVRVHGGWSRANRQKSLRVFARSDYDEQSSIRHEVFPGHQKQGGNGTLREFKRLILHNSGQDNGLTLFRDAMAQSLIAHTGIDTQAYRPAIVFLNGEYWGIHNIIERYDHHYVATNYDMDPDDVAILQGNAQLVHGSTTDSQQFLSFRNYVKNHANGGTINRSDVWLQIQEQMDVDNFIHHFIAQIYYANIDWPAGNLRWWRYKGTPDPSRHGHDGKWRWMLFDTDHGFGLFVFTNSDGTFWNITSGHDTVAHALSKGPLLWSNPAWATDLFTSLVKNTEFRNRFLNTFADHMNTSFQPERVVARINEMQAVLAPEYPEYARRWNQPATFWSGGNTWEEKVDVMRNFANTRLPHLRAHLRAHFNLSGTSSVTVGINRAGGTVRLNSLHLQQGTPGINAPVYPWSGTYFLGLPLELEAIPEAGFRFVRWATASGQTASQGQVLQGTLLANIHFVAEFEPDPLAFAEAVPPPHRLAEGPFYFSQWNADAPAGSYPANMVFEQTATQDPGLQEPMDSFWTLPYNLSSRSRIEGLGQDGIGFINTANAQEDPAAGFLGSAVVALDTLGVEQASVSWVGGTILPNSRVYHLRLQYRIGNEGAFTDLTDTEGAPVEYLRDAIAGHLQTLGPVPLPVTLLDKPYVQLRWKYYATGERLDEASGQRTMLRLDDIVVTSGSSTAQPQLASRDFHPAAQAGGKVWPFEVRAELQDGLTDATFTGVVTLELISGPAPLGGTTEATAVEGLAFFESVVVNQPGLYQLRAVAEGADPIMLPPLRVVAVTEEIMPRFIQGEQPDNSQRVPFAYRLRLEGLLANAEYRYANRVVTAADPVNQDGAGNAVFVTPGGSAFTRTTSSPRFLDSDTGVRHQIFTTDSDGSFAGWFITEPSGNVRFTPGNEVFMRLLLNDGNGSEEAFHYLTTASPVNVLAFGNGPDDASAVLGQSYGNARNFLTLHDSEWPGSRPLLATPIEDAGFGVDDRYAAFYATQVSGRPGWWGGLTPNRLAGGVVRVELVDQAGLTTGLFRFPAGLPGTHNPTDGSAATVVEIREGVATYGTWRAVQLYEGSDPGGPGEAPNGDGITNLLRYAFGLDPSEPGGTHTTTALDQEDFLVIRFPADLSLTDVAYRVEASPNLTSWTETLYDSSTDPQPQRLNGLLEVRDLLPIHATDRTRFLRVRVTWTNE